MGLRGAVRKADRGRVQSLEGPCANQSQVRVQISTIASIEQFMTVTSEQYIYITRTKVRELYCFGSCTEMAYCICFRQTIEHRSGKGMVVFLHDILSSFTFVLLHGKKIF